MKTLGRYLFKELLFPFAMGITIFTFILIMDKIFTLSDLIVKYGVSVFTVGRLLLYILPATFAITIPMGCLVGVMVGFSRWKSDHEITAIKASGISLLLLLLRLMVAGTLLTLGMIWFNNTVLPKANYAYRDLYFKIVSKRAAIIIKEHIFVEDFDGYVFRVGAKNPLTGALKNIVLFVQNPNPQEPPRAILARRGQLISDETNRRVMLKLEDGFMHILDRKDPRTFTRVDFGVNFLDLDINRQLMRPELQAGRSAREMSMQEIRRQIELAGQTGENRNLLWVEFHKKFSIPFACLAFVLIGAPLGILAPRSGKYFSYFIGVALIFIYYIFISLGETFGADGRMPPLLSMWLPNLLLMAAGGYGFSWVLREQPPGWPRRHPSGTSRRPGLMA